MEGWALSRRVCLCSHVVPSVALGAGSCSCPCPWGLLRRPRRRPTLGPQPGHLFPASQPHLLPPPRPSSF